jgi:hypothetical protein
MVYLHTDCIGFPGGICGSGEIQQEGIYLDTLFSAPVYLCRLILVDVVLCIQMRAADLRGYSGDTGHLL